VYLAATDVHAVGDGVRELGSDRSGLATDAPEVVEKPRPLGRQLLQQGGEVEDVDASIIVTTCATS
jgi:hypothetical protein